MKSIIRDLDLYLAVKEAINQGRAAQDLTEARREDQEARLEIEAAADRPKLEAEA